MIAKIFMTIGILIYGLLVPILEINGTHVFNPEWTPHARLHDVWQLTTNTSLGIYCLWLVWHKEVLNLPAFVAAVIAGGYLFAYAVRGAYDGADGGYSVMGFSAAVITFIFVIVLSVIAAALGGRRKPTPV